MKQVVQNFKTGVVSVEDVPSPKVKPGCVLVRNRASLISAGTEGGMVKLGKMSLLSKAKARPEQVKKVIKSIQTEGILPTLSAVSRTLDLPIPIGYSCAGEVVEVGEGVTDLFAGDHVACGGGGMAFHAGTVVIPRKLCTAIPDGISFEEAAFTTVGAIALQGVRIADRTLGEHVTVIGLGLVGLLTVEILKAAGCHVLGVDIDRERVRWVQDRGICKAIDRRSENIVDRILEATDGNGADAVIITAAVNSNDPVSLAGQIARYKGRVVVVGRTKMDAPRDTFLFKELELCTSLAYGPGTGDDSYELSGHDYPIGYVRWTENRNMQCFLDLVKEKKILIKPFITQQYSINDAAKAFENIIDSSDLNVGVILTYDCECSNTDQIIRRIDFPVKKNIATNLSSPIRVGIIGTGSFATNIILPIIYKINTVKIVGLVSSSGIKAAALGKKYNVPLISSDANELIESNDIDCLLILTRHDSHATYAERGLLNGKHIFVEKPLALTEAQLNNVIEAQIKSKRVLMVGFNRRYSPLAQKVKDFFKNRCQPMMISFRGNVGYRPPQHWLHHPTQGGGVILGEACHYIDFCRWIVSSPIVTVKSECAGHSKTSLIPEDNVIISLGFEDGSLGTVHYISNGAPSFGREICEMHADNKSAVWTDFKRVKMVGNSLFPHYHINYFSNKGYKEELQHFFNAINTNISDYHSWLNTQIDSSRASILASNLLKKNPIL